MDFVRAVIRHRLVAQDTLQSRLDATPIEDSRRATISSFISRDFSAPA
jgi:hypothetical protein